MATLAQAMLNLSARLPIEDKKVSDRLNRAYDIVRLLGQGYSITKKENGYEVYKESTSLLEDKSVYYWVEHGQCSCPDNSTARAGLCKHVLATMLMSEMA